jgi:hypothetical protein
MTTVMAMAANNETTRFMDTLLNRWKACTTGERVIVIDPNTHRLRDNIDRPGRDFNAVCRVTKPLTD